MPDGENDDNSQAEVARPGAVISPASPAAQDVGVTLSIDHSHPEPAPTPPPAQPPQPAPEPPAPHPEQVAPPQAPPVEPQPAPVPQAPVEQPPPPAPQESGGFFKPEDETSPESPDSGDLQPVTWTASEFVAHDKSLGWYLGLAVAAGILAFFVYLISKDLISVSVVVVAALVLAIYGSHRPRQLEYQLDNHGLIVGNKQYAYAQFRSFSVIPEGSAFRIDFMPLKRFATVISAYYTPEDEEKIMSVLTGCLPYAEARRDTVDSLMKRIRF